MNPLMTIGYQHRSVDDLIAVLTDADAEVVVDVRLTPLSRKPGFSKKSLATTLHAAGIEYLHLPQLGNPRDNRDAFRRGDTVAVAAYRDVLTTPEGQAALGELVQLASQRRVALICFERDAAGCHRSIVADALVDAGAALPVVHL